MIVPICDSNCRLSGKPIHAVTRPFVGREWFLRKTVPVLALVVVSLLVVVGAAYYLTSRDTSECSDPDSISSHIYNPDRLDVIKSCTTASGFVYNVLTEPDGDFYIRLALHSQ